MQRRKKIVYVTDGLWPWVVGGMQTVARRHVEWLVGGGYDVTVVHGMSESAHDEGFDMHRIPWRRSGGLAKLNPWHYANELHNFSKGVSEMVDRVSPSLVYSEGPLLSDYLARPRAARVPTIFHPHGMEMFQQMGSRLLSLRAWPLRGLMRQHATEADRVVTQGGHLTQILKSDLAVDSSRIVYVPNCVPHEFPLRTDVRASHKRRFLFVGRPERRKGLHLLLQAFRELAPDLTLDVVGSTGAKRDDRDNIEFHGSVRDMKAIVYRLDLSDYLVVPSFSEGMATVITEAFGRAMPVIATDVGATCELVLPRKTGWLIRPGDRNALSQALRIAGELDNGTYAAMSEACLRLATRDFSPLAVRAKFLSLVGSLLDCRMHLE